MRCVMGWFTCLLLLGPFVPPSRAGEAVAGALPPHFVNDIEPILSRFRCNSAGCHGKAEGQNGFKLSVFAFDPAADYVALTQESRGRRVFPAAPDHSLLLRKICGRIPHGGGVRIPTGSEEYKLLRTWIAAGAPFGNPNAPRVASIRVSPRQQVLAMSAEQLLHVQARYTDGREVDVTRHARFQSNNESLATVDENGVVHVGSTPGQVAIMAAYMGAVDVFQALIPRAKPIARRPSHNDRSPIDRLVFDRLESLHIVPSAPADDAMFLRRVYLDTIGTLPTAEEARHILADTRPDRRARLVDDLLKRPEFADYWALKWADLLRVDRQALGHKDAYAFYRWIRASIAANKPLDQFAREIALAEGPLGEVGPASFYKSVSKPGDAAGTLAQVFLGVRIACAQCHHHPFDRWSPSDYYGMQAFFTPVNVRKAGTVEEVVAKGEFIAKNARTGEIVAAHALGDSAPVARPAGDQRRLFADWLTNRDNPWFARNLANRAWAHFLGRGLIEPVDDIRATNPPSNPQLLDLLARDLIASGYDFRALVRTITCSQVYQLSSAPNATNERDEQNYSRALFKRIDAEVLLDMVCQTTGVPERFRGMPPGQRAIQLWDSKVPHYFLKLFGRPVRVSACECERNGQPSVAQVLHLLNGPEIHAKLTHPKGRIANIVARLSDDRALVDELYLNFYSRYPSEAERGTALAYLQSKTDDRNAAAEDLAWAMMNSLEFIFNH